MSRPSEQLTAKALADDVKRIAGRSSSPLRFMEVCGTHTMAIAESGLRSLFPDNLHLVSGPGCPVCVTEKRFIDHALAIGRTHGACLATFGDLVRVPGSSGSLANFRAEGGKVGTVYSPLDSIAIAAREYPTPVVFLGVGFETTIPTIAATFQTALAQGVDNLYLLCAFKTIHQPLKILAGKGNIDGFLLPGHVSAIVGSDGFGYLVADFGKPGVVAGFDPLDILLAVRDLAASTVDGPPKIINDYKKVVRAKGNPAAQRLIDEVFRPADASWRGLGLIPGSGLSLREPYDRFDAAERFPVEVVSTKDDPRCLCAAILTGSRTPDRCALFGRECTPETPFGPCMVSSEGSCAAYFKYGT